MADFRTHITVSTVVGIGLGVIGRVGFDMSLSNSALAAGLCSIAGMLPDLDSDSGIPFRETVCASAAVMPLLLIDRFQEFGWSSETMAFAGLVIYLFFRFVVAELFRRYTVHRGMWHSLPAAAIAGLVAYLLCSSSDQDARMFKSFAVVLGFITHLVLDEIWAVDFRYGVPRVKKSFGSALKLWSETDQWANISTYGKLILITFIAFGDPVWMNKYRDQRDKLNDTANSFVRQLTLPEEESVVR